MKKQNSPKLEQKQNDEIVAAQTFQTNIHSPKGRGQRWKRINAVRGTFDMNEPSHN